MEGRRQFLISKAKTAPVEGWKSYMIGSRWVHACPELLVSTGVTTDRVPACLIGLAVSVADDSDPGDMLSRVLSSELVKAYRGWAGRWALVIGNELHGDASVNLGVFYVPTAGLVSSSAALLSHLTEAEVRPREIAHGLGVDWYPGPLTRARGVLRLLPSQVLQLDSLSILHRPLLTSVGAANLAQALVTGLRNIGRKFGECYLPLTGGIDSRTVLAASTAAHLKPVTYTFDKPSNTNGDRLLPPKLAAAVGTPHKYVRRGRFTRARQEEFDSHTLGQCVDIDREYWAFGQWHALQARGVILRGGCFEFGRHLYHRKMPDAVVAAGLSIDELLARKQSRWLRGRQPIVQEGLATWLDWARTHPEEGLDMRDRLYWEQRLGSWLSSIEQGLDLVGVERIHIANSHLVYGLLNQIPHELGKSGAVQKEIIRQLVPKLSEFRFNPPDPIARKVRSRALKTAKQGLRVTLLMWGARDLTTV